jgi:F0F1-type ATP synthase delta subunit
LVQFAVNRKLLDGFRLRHDGKVSDASLAETLRRLEAHLCKTEGGMYAR